MSTDLRDLMERHGLVPGRSEAIRRCLDELVHFAPFDLPLLLRGETGTGKTVFARLVHGLSGRRGHFVQVDLPSLPETLFASALFGHERGAFTGADRASDGLVGRAAGGTLFLEEVGDLPPQHQPRLLSFLSDRRFHRVGGVEELRSDARIVSATHRRLEPGAGFRDDLFFRLGAVAVRIPPLRERAQDIPELAERILATFPPPSQARLRLADCARRALVAAPWPGNVRELEAVVKRACVRAIVAGSRAVRVEHLDPPAPRIPGRWEEAHAALRTELVLAALRASGGRVAGAARALGLSRPRLHHWIDVLGLQGELDRLRGKEAIPVSDPSAVNVRGG